ncbi:hypothetical protein [Streptomyces griseofuscus]|uniref:hypothetical protein n=1 Tax=Streptomyces griseofuscus TaxID=146922 RepID=UPI003810973C
MVGQEVGDGGADGAAADLVIAGEGCDRAALQIRAYVGGLVGRDGRAAPALLALGLGGPQPAVGELPLEVALELAGGGKGLHRELHGGQQLAGARVTGGKVHRGERAVVDAQRDLVAVEDVETSRMCPVPRTRRNISDDATRRRHSLLLSKSPTYISVEEP